MVAMRFPTAEGAVQPDRADPDDELRSPPERLVRRTWPHGRGIPYFEVKGVAAKHKAYAIVNDGRWIVRCPFCPSAQYASTTDPRFFCTNCLHEGTTAEGKWVRVVWPSDEDAAQIEDLLIARPMRDGMFTPRNWEADEPLDFLRQQNAGMP